MSKRQRLNDIVNLVVQRHEVSVADLAEQFAVSAATIRRDLELLEGQRLVRRTHGGVVPHGAFTDVPTDLKADQNAPEKLRIARAALPFLKNARIVGLTGGTTVTAFSKFISSAEPLTVVTNALSIATDLVGNRNLRVFAAGGEVRDSSHETIGPDTEAFFEPYNVDVAFLGVDGVDLNAGYTNYDPRGCSANLALRLRAQKTVVLADSSKIGRVALAKMCGVSEIDVLITDDGADPAFLSQIRARGCTIVVA